MGKSLTGGVTQKKIRRRRFIIARRALLPQPSTTRGIDIFPWEFACTFAPRERFFYS